MRRQLVQEPTPVVLEITEDVACIHCGYNLRGLRSDGRCPECNTDIRRSQHENLLKFAEPSRLRRVTLGANLMYWGIVIGILTGLFGGLVAGLTRNALLLAAVTAAAPVLSAVLHLAAVFLITTQEPRISLTEAAVTWRKAVRVAASAGLALQALYLLPALPTQAGLFIVVQLGLGVAGFVTTFGEFTYARSFALRIPDLKLARSTNIVKWGLSIIMLLAAFGGIIAVLWLGAGLFAPPGAAPRTAPPAGPATGVMGIACAVSLAYLVFALWACRLLWRYRKALRAALAEARTTSTANHGPAA